ncbi:hypothetical protein Tco_0708944 [Tanacetum coccineum]
MKLHGILQFLTKPGKQVRDYKDATKESVQANVIDKVKKFLPKLLPKVVKDALEKTSLLFAQSSSPDQSAIKVVESHSQYELKKILYAKMNKSQDRGVDQDEDPSAGPNQGIKKRRTRKDVEPSKKPSKSKESAKGKTPSITSKSGKSISAYKSVHEIEHIVQMDVEKPNLTNVADDTNEPQADTTLKIPKKDCHGFNSIYKVEKPPLMFDELMSTPIDFFAFTMNRLKLNKITIADLVGLVFNLLKGTCKSYVELEYNMEECYRSLTDHSTGKPRSVTKIEKKSGYGYLKEIVVRQADQKLYKFKEGDFSDLHLNDIKDMLLLKYSKTSSSTETVLGVESYQRKLNLTRPQRTCLHISIKEPYTLNFDPPGVIYEDICKKKRLMRVDEIHKFCDKTLQSVRNTLHERLLNFKFGYNKDMPSREWTSKDKRHIGIMVNKIDDRLFKRRILRSLKVLVGRRKTEMDKRFQNWKDLSKDIPLDRIEVLRSDTKGVKVRKGIMQTKKELTLEQTQQGVSDEVLVSIDGVEE